MDKKNMTPAHVPLVPQPVWGSFRDPEADSIAAPERWFFYQGHMYPMRACFLSNSSIPVSDFVSAPLPPNHADPSLIFGDARITMRLPNHRKVSVGDIFPTMTIGQEVATLKVEEISPHYPPDGFKTVVFIRVDDEAERPISLPVSTSAQ